MYNYGLSLLSEHISYPKVILQPRILKVIDILIILQDLAEDKVFRSSISVNLHKGKITFPIRFYLKPLS